MTWRYDLRYKDQTRWETGFDSYDDAYDAMNESMSGIIDEEAEKYPGLSHEEIGGQIEWEVLEE